MARRAVRVRRWYHIFHEWTERHRSQHRREDVERSGWRRKLSQPNQPVTLITYGCVVRGCTAFKQVVLRGNVPAAAG